ncbi:DUF1801 domain-containing protein [Pedobacter sp. SYP-B3415]|uniref:DUF1801 domain-containing protein n=1 Tax=Pedobacter sp. SYP-B3415 TaxID=2496641 RepID=UPI00101CD629|nr:DUF1801 domain-containing protein [Pedobacter sp. SYP-B3415]
METATVNPGVNDSSAAFRDAVMRLTELCRKTLKGYDEGTSYGMHAYKRNGVSEVAFDFRQTYLKLYVMKHDLLNNFRHRLNGLLIGKGCIWFSQPEDLDFRVIENILEATCNTPACLLKKI